MSKSKVTIIIPTYNRLEKLKKVLPSYLEQDYLHEIIIIDDNSSDGTGNYIKENYPELKYIKLSKKQGAPFAKQIGVDNAESKYILFGEDDLYFSKDYTKILLEHLKQNNADIIGGRLIRLKKNESEKEAIIRSDNSSEKKLYDRFFRGNFNIFKNNDEKVLFLHACFLAKREVFTKIKYDKNYKGNGFREETDPLIEAVKTGFEIYFCAHTTCFHLPRGIDKGGQHHMSKLNYEYWRYKNNLYFLKKHKDFFKKENIIIFNPYIDNFLYFINKFLKFAKKKLLS